MAESKRAVQRQINLERILAVSWDYLAEYGAPALSLRGVARELGMTVPGMYRYYPSRDALLTALSNQAFDDFTQTLQAARDSLDPKQTSARMQSVLQSYFIWGISHPERYHLIFGAPFAGYQMASEVFQASQGVMDVFYSIIGQALAQGQIRLEGKKRELRLSSLVRPSVLPEQTVKDERVTEIGLMLWSQIHGFTSLFLEGYLSQYEPEDRMEALVQRYIRILLAGSGFD